ncbi:hypothetical protein LXL04_017869 [Taraxacum kok-saghyz]
MPLDHQIRSIVRSRTRTRRRSACHRHPNEPVTNFCALCLRDRLAGLESLTDQLELEHETIISFPLSRRTRGHGDASSSGAVPELRRSKSVAVEKCEVLNGSSLDLRRKSCDVRSNNRLTDLFDIDDTKIGRNGPVRVESKNIGVSGIGETLLEINEDNDGSSGVKTSDDSSVQNEIGDNGDIGEDEDLRTMKELIEMELQNKKRNFWDATASVFSQKLRKWRQKHKEKKPGDVSNGGTDNNRSKMELMEQSKDPQIQSELPAYVLGRRSCDTEPRYSIDPHRMSVEDPRFSYEEHRASWDGYMIARTIPRLTPMLPIVDDLTYPPVNKGIPVSNQQVLRIREEGSCSGTSAQFNSDTSSLNTESSSSSIKSSSSKITRFQGDDTKPASNGQETKLVITERELKDWHLNSINTSTGHLSTHTTVKNMHKKEMTNRWRKMSNLWSHKYKNNKDDINGASLNENIDIKRGNSNGKLIRNSSYVGSRNKSELHPNVEEGGRHSMSDVDSSLLKLHLPPFVKSRKKLPTSMANS